MSKQYYQISTTGYPVVSSIELEGFIEYTVGEEPQELVDAFTAVTMQETKGLIELAIQSMLDAKVKELHYDNMMSARSYAGFANPFQAEAQALAVWCAECWAKAGELEATGKVYTVDEVLADMPTYSGV